MPSSSLFHYEPLYPLDRAYDIYDAIRSVARPIEPEHHHKDLRVRTITPRMNLYEDEARNTVTATFEFPGLKKEDIQIEVHSGRLTVSADPKVPSEAEAKNFVILERRYGKHSRTLLLPKGVEREDIKASLNDGILTVTFPKSTPEAEAQKVAID